VCLWCVRTQSHNHTHIYIIYTYLYYHFWQRIVFVIIIAIYEKIIQDLAKYKQHVWEIWAVLASPMLLLYPFLTCLPLARSPPKSSTNSWGPHFNTPGKAVPIVAGTNSFIFCWRPQIPWAVAGQIPALYSWLNIWINSSPFVCPFCCWNSKLL